MKQPVKMSVEIEALKLNRKIEKMQRKSNQSLKRVFSAAMNLFVQSAVKLTPPGKKAKDLASKRKRRIIPITPDQVYTFQKFISDPKNRVTNPHSFWNYVLKKFPEGHPWRGKYKVHINGRIKKTRLFSSRAMAKDYQDIKYRNTMKYAWITGAFKAGIKPTAKRPPVTSWARQKANTLSDGRLSRGVRGLVAYISSKVHGMNKLKPYVVAQSLRKTNARLYHALKRAEKDVVK